MSDPTVTVIHTCYNHEKFVIESLESVRNQLFQDFEWIILDDASTDNSVSLIIEWIERNQVDCQFIPHSKNKGFCATLNEAIRLARGTYISYFSADDVMMTDKLKVQVALFEERGEKVGVVYSNAYQIDDDGQDLRETFFDTHRNIEPHPDGDISKTLMGGNFIPAPSTMIRKACYEKVGGYDERLTLEDWDMWLRISLHFHFAYSPYFGIKYRQHENNTYKKINNSNRERLVNTFFSFESLLNSGMLDREQKKLSKREIIKSVAHLCRCLCDNRRQYLLRALRCTYSIQVLIILGINCLLPKRLESSLLNYLWKLFKMRQIPSSVEL